MTKRSIGSFIYMLRLPKLDYKIYCILRVSIDWAEITRRYWNSGVSWRRKKASTSAWSICPFWILDVGWTSLGHPSTTSYCKCSLSWQRTSAATSDKDRSKELQRLKEGMSGLESHLSPCRCVSERYTGNGKQSTEWKAGDRSAGYPDVHLPIQGKMIWKRWQAIQKALTVSLSRGQCLFSFYCTAGTNSVSFPAIFSKTINGSFCFDVL